MVNMKKTKSNIQRCADDNNNKDKFTSSGFEPGKDFIPRDFEIVFYFYCILYWYISTLEGMFFS